jgi:hypothetical protein
VYLSSTRNSHAGVFVAVLDGIQTKIDGYSASADESCSYTFSQSQLTAGFHNLTVSLVGPSPQAPMASDGDGAFQLNDIQYVSRLYFDAALSEFRRRLIGTDTSSKPSGSISSFADTSTVFFGLLCILLVQGF